MNDTIVTGRTPLMLAVEFENDLTVKYLLSKPGIHVNASDSEGNTALILACELGEFGVEIAKLLLQSKADPNCENRKKKSPLTIACKSQNLELVHALLDHQVLALCRFLVSLIFLSIFDRCSAVGLPLLCFREMPRYSFTRGCERRRKRWVGARS